MYPFIRVRRVARRSVAALFVGAVLSSVPVISVAALQTASADTVGELAGSVANAQQKPLAGADIRVINAAGHAVATATTDSGGHYSIAGLAPGHYTVTARLGKKEIGSAEVDVVGGSTVQAPIASVEQLKVLTVTAQRLERARAELSPTTGSSQYKFDETAIASLPQGDNTPFNEVLLQAPGVANDSFGQVHIRGDHNDLQYRINGIILPDGVSGFGQVFDPRFAKSITLNTGALPAEYGLRTAGVIDIVTKDRFDGGDVDMYGGSHDTVNPSFQAGKTVGDFSSYVTGQYLSSNLGVENPTDSSSPIHDWTQQGKGFGYFSYLLNSNTKLSALVGSTSTRLELPNDPGQPVDPNGQFLPPYTNFNPTGFTSANINDRQYERNLYEIGALQGIGANDLTYQLAVFDRESTVQFVPDTFSDLAFDYAASTIKRKASEVGVQGDLSYPLGMSHTLSTGFAASSEDIRADNTSTVFCTYPSAGQPPNTNPACPAQTPGEPLSTPITIVDNNPKNGNTLASVYVQDKWDITKDLTVNYGLRYDHISAFVTGEQLSPRLGMIDYLTPTTTIHAGYARYYTPPPSELIANSSISKFQNTTLAQTPIPNCIPSATNTCVLNDPVLPERSHYFDAGVLQQVTSHYSAGLDAYYRYARNLIDEGQFGTALIFTPFNYEQGHVYGLEFTNGYRAGKLSAYLNLARSIAQATDNISAQAVAFPDPSELAYVSQHYIYLDHDQAITASGGVSYKWLSTTWGMEGTYEDGLREGFANTGKLKPNVQLDLSANRTVHVSDGFGNLDLRTAVINVLDRKNEIRDGSGVGVFAPQYGPRAAIYFGIGKPFSL